MHERPCSALFCVPVVSEIETFSYLTNLIANHFKSFILGKISSRYDDNILIVITRFLTAFGP